MKRFLGFLLIVGLSFSVLATEEWRQDGTENTILGSENAADIDQASYENIVKPLDRVLGDYRTVRLAYASASTITIKSGGIVTANSDSSGHKMRFNTSDLTVTWSDIDTGAEANSTTYYVYAVSDAVADTFTASISTSSSAPTGATFYARIGSFYNDSSGNITLINNDNEPFEVGDLESKSVNVTYQATTDGEVVVSYTVNDGGSLRYTVLGYSDSSSSPTTRLGASFQSQKAYGSATGLLGGFSFPVKQGDYYKVTKSSSGASGENITMYWVPKQ